MRAFGASGVTTYEKNRSEGGPISQAIFGPGDPAADRGRTGVWGSDAPRTRPH